MWRINRPDLGFVGDGYMFEVLVRSVAHYRIANGIPIGLGFEDELEQALCGEYPQYCTTDDPREPLKPVALGFKDVTLGTKVAASFAKSGFKTVTPEEAQSRANICRGCRFNVLFSKGCGGGICGELLDLVQKIVPHTQINDDGIEACYICHCYLKAAIWLPQETQWNPMSEHMKAQFKQAPEACWKVPRGNFPTQ
jgi:hypothetical protein